MVLKGIINGYTLLQCEGRGGLATASRGQLQKGGGGGWGRGRPDAHTRNHKRARRVARAFPKRRRSQKKGRHKRTEGEYWLGHGPPGREV